MVVKVPILSMGACTTSSYALQFGLRGTFSPIADFGFLSKAVSTADKMKVN